jgi:hypothetical protein
MAPRRPRRGSGRNLEIANKLMKDINKVVASGVQNAAIEITNGLVDVGPAWSGEFSASWDVVGPGQSASSPRGKGRIYRYDKRNFPLSRFEKAIEKGVKQFEVVNSAPHAAIAIDGEEAIFIHPNDSDPLKDPVEFGFRPKDAGGEQEPSFRYDISMGYDDSSKPNSMITAERDWLATYAVGGGLSRDLGRGVSIGFGGIR